MEITVEGARKACVVDMNKLDVFTCTGIGPKDALFVRTQDGDLFDLRSGYVLLNDYARFAKWEVTTYHGKLKVTL